MNKKIILSVFLGLLASASALVASLFMLQQLQGTTDLPGRIANLENAYNNINTTVDLGPVREEISALSGTVQTIGQDLNELQAEVGSSTSSPVTPSVPVSDNTDEPQPTAPETPVNVTVPTAEKPDFVTDARLNFRTSASIKGGISKTFAVGEKLTYLNEKVEKDGYTWLKVKDSKGKTGWVAQRYTKSN